MPLKFYLYIGIALVMLAMAGTISFLYRDVQSKAAEIAVKEQQLATATAHIKALEERREQDQKQILTISLENQASLLEVNRIREMLEDAKSRNNVVVAKPVLVEKLANRATKKVFDNLECISGNLESCQ